VITTPPLEQDQKTKEQLKSNLDTFKKNVKSTLIPNIHKNISKITPKEKYGMNFTNIVVSNIKVKSTENSSTESLIFKSEIEGLNEMHINNESGLIRGNCMGLILPGVQSFGQGSTVYALHQNMKNSEIFKNFFGETKGNIDSSIEYNATQYPENEIPVYINRPSIFAMHLAKHQATPFPNSNEVYFPKLRVESMSSRGITEEVIITDPDTLGTVQADIRYLIDTIPKVTPEEAFNIGFEPTNGWATWLHAGDETVHILLYINVAFFALEKSEPLTSSHQTSKDSQDPTKNSSSSLTNNNIAAAVEKAKKESEQLIAQKKEKVEKAALLHYTNIKQPTNKL